MDDSVEVDVNMVHGQRLLRVNGVGSKLEGLVKPLGEALDSHGDD